MGIDLNPLSGQFDEKGRPDNYSATNRKNVRIPAGQQMLYKGHIVVDGHWRIQGDLVEISDIKEQFFYDRINVGETVVVEPDRLLLFKGHLQIEGHLRINGRLVEA